MGAKDASGTDLMTPLLIRASSRTTSFCPSPMTMSEARRSLSSGLSFGTSYTSMIILHSISLLLFSSFERINAASFENPLRIIAAASDKPFLSKSRDISSTSFPGTPFRWMISFLPLLFMNLIPLPLLPMNLIPFMEIG